MEHIIGKRRKVLKIIYKKFWWHLFSLTDDEEDEEDEAYYTDAFDGMKQRMTTLNGKADKMEKVVHITLT